MIQWNVALTKVTLGGNCFVWTQCEGSVHLGGEDTMVGEGCEVAAHSAPAGRGNCLRLACLLFIQSEIQRCHLFSGLLFPPQPTDSRNIFPDTPRSLSPRPCRVDADIMNRRQEALSI